jgi:hypothetical protein
MQNESCIERDITLIFKNIRFNIRGNSMPLLYSFIWTNELITILFRCQLTAIKQFQFSSGEGMFKLSNHQQI